MKARAPPKPFSYFFVATASYTPGSQVIYVVEMSEWMSCKSHFSFLLTFTEMVFVKRINRENDETYDDHDELHREFLREQKEYDAQSYVLFCVQYV